jgi:hypothetical protein
LEVLQVFKHATKALESNNSTLQNALPALDFLLERLEDFKTQYTGNSVMTNSINSAWSKLDKYYSKTDDTVAYSAAVALHPAYKLEWF